MRPRRCATSKTTAGRRVTPPCVQERTICVLRRVSSITSSLRRSVSILFSSAIARSMAIIVSCNDLNVASASMQGGPSNASASVCRQARRFITNCSRTFFNVSMCSGAPTRGQLHSVTKRGLSSILELSSDSDFRTDEPDITARERLIGRQSKDTRAQCSVMGNWPRVEGGW